MKLGIEKLITNHISKSSSETLLVQSKTSIDYTAEFKQNIGGEQVLTNIRLITRNAIISPDMFKTYNWVLKSLPNLVEAILDKHNTTNSETYGIISFTQINYMGIAIGEKAKGKDWFEITLGIKKQEHLITAEFLGTEIIYLSYDG